MDLYLIFAIITIFYSHSAISAEIIDLNEACRGYLFEAIQHPNDSHSFIGCVQGKGSLFNCPNGEFFNVNTHSCSDFTDTTIESTTDTDTSTDTTTTSSPSVTSSEPNTSTTSPETTTDSSNVGVTFRCPSSGFGLIPHPTDCSRYFECIAGIRYGRDCNQGLYFDIITSTCLEPELGFCAANLQCV
jgi:hypothetical protein